MHDAMRIGSRFGVVRDHEDGLLQPLIQIAEQLQAVGAPLRVNVCTILGGMSQMQQSLAVSRKPHVVVATPAMHHETLVVA